MQASALEGETQFLMIYGPMELYALAQRVGFPADTAVKMAAIALRESGGNPTAYNPGTAGSESSYGLWQINMRNVPERLALFGIADESELLNPETNARAAYILWNGDDQNLERHWYINRVGSPYGYAEKYQRYLAQVQALVAATPQQPGYWSLSPFQDLSAALQSQESGPSSGPDWRLVGVLGIAAFVLVDLVLD